MHLADLDLNKAYSYADYLKWHFEERLELIKGKIFKMSPAATPRHQTIVGFIFVELSVHLRKQTCRVYTAPFDVRIPRKTTEDKDIITVLQPDICVICDRSKIDRKGCLGAPDIIVEVLSPGNNAKELKNKYDAYEEAGVKEYWIVSPQDQTFTINLLVDVKFQPTRQLTNGDTVTSTILPGFCLNLTELFESPLPEEG